MADKDPKPGDGAVASPAKEPEKQTPAPAAAAPAAATPAALTEAQVQALIDQRFAARMKAENDRVAGIKALAKKGNEAMIEQCVADASCSVNDAKARLYDHEAAIAKARLDALKTDELKGGKPASAATPADGEQDPRAAGRAAAARLRTMHGAKAPAASATSNA